MALETIDNKLYVTPDDHWIWLGSVNFKGFGQVRIKGKWCLAHRVIYHRERPNCNKSIDLKQTCGIRLCCNPDHIMENARRAHWWNKYS